MLVLSSSSAELFTANQKRLKISNETFETYFDRLGRKTKPK